MNHIYYRITFRAASSISVGSGEDRKSDHDVIRRKNGRPYIPASSIAGVFRHYYDKKPALRNELFGTIKGETTPSALIFYDAELTGACSDNIRDSVKLKDKVAAKGAKFDMEVIESGAVFVTYLELDQFHSQYTEAVEELLCAMQSGVLRFGHKTSRGYGVTEITDVRRISFALEDPAGLDAWLGFDLMHDACWENAVPLSVDTIPQNCLRIDLKLRQQSGLSIRTYSTDVAPDLSHPLPDFKQMTMQNGTPVIPGTSWAGAFRERFRLFTDESQTDALFGYVKERTQETQRSRICFSESQITGATCKEMTRNSIDRFSSATKDTALYTESTCYSGETGLTITLLPDANGDAPSAAERTALSAVLLDLHNGFLALGGLTSVGRGIFSIEQITVNGEDRTNMLAPEHVAALLEV
ncbi:MAG: hypothetical protein K5695_15325 [Oscillospiraceae bacterium]|nr:hypothetical protein [Oscillospiraceae bacterium]